MTSNSPHQVKIVLNPIAGRGYGARSEQLIREFLTTAEVDFSLVRTEYPGHATELARQAARDGFDTVVAAGGDGTTQEVVNGLKSKRWQRERMVDKTLCA